MALIQFRRGTAAQWTAANPVLASGEPGRETDTGRRKVGNGSTAWNSLPYEFDNTAAGAAYVGGRACTVTGVAGLPAPTGVGLEFVISSAGLDDIRLNGTSL